MSKFLYGKRILKKGLAEIVLALKEEGWSALKIARYLKEQGYEVSDQTIRNFLKWGNGIKDLEVKDRIKEVVKDLKPEKEIEVFKQLVEALNLTLELIKRVEEDVSLKSEVKTVLLDRLNKSRVYICDKLFEFYGGEEFRKLLEQVFDEISFELAAYFKEKELSVEVINEIVEILKKVWQKFTEKFEKLAK